MLTSCFLYPSQFTPSILKKHVVLDKISVKQLEYKS
jgi:hypothetical protein